MPSLPRDTEDDDPTEGAAQPEELEPGKPFPQEQVCDGGHDDGRGRGEQRHVGGVGRMPCLIDEGVETGDAEQGHENDFAPCAADEGKRTQQAPAAKGRMVRNAMLQRQKDSSTGESAPARPRATTKFPLQTTVASRANRYPVTVWEKMGMAGSRGLGGPDGRRFRRKWHGGEPYFRVGAPSTGILSRASMCTAMRGWPFYPVCVRWRNRVDLSILISGERYPMRLLIASDLHGSPEAAAFLRRRCEELLPDMLVLLGDYLYHGPRNPLPSSYGPPSVVSVFADFETPIVAVRGNCDAEVDLMLLPFAVEDSAVIAADGLRIVAQHGHHLPSCPPIPGVRPGDVVLSGHTHIPRGETVDGVHFWNPGSTTLPKGGFPASYGVFEAGAFRVFGLDGRFLLEHRPSAA